MTIRKDMPFFVQEFLMFLILSLLAIQVYASMSKATRYGILSEAGTRMNYYLNSSNNKKSKKTIFNCLYVQIRMLDYSILELRERVS